MTKNTFKNADEAYKYFFREIIKNGVEFDDTKALFNVGFTIENPVDNHIVNKGSIVPRNWKQDYAQAEWQWYLTGDRNISKLGEIYGKVPEIWKRMANSLGQVNSNYGYQWERNDQLDSIITHLRVNPKSRRAAISIYDAKEMHKYANDTPCTYACLLYTSPSPRD